MVTKLAPFQQNVMKGHLLIFLLLTECVIASCNLLSAQNRSEEAIRIDTRLVSVPVTVFDWDGRHYSGGALSNFTIFENGVEQVIEIFESSKQPVTVMLLIDTSGSMEPYVPLLARSLAAFVQQLRDDDKFLIASFADDSNIALLQKPVRKSDFRETIKIMSARGDSFTTTFDAVDKAMSLMQGYRGRKAIVVFTDGELFGRRASESSNLRNALEQEALIYTIRFGEYPTHQPGLRDAGASQFSTYGKLTEKERRKLIERTTRYLSGLSSSTGGRSIEVNDGSNLTDAFRAVAEELGHQYLLGYYASAPLRDNEKRTIKVKCDIPNTAVRSRTEVVFKKNKASK